MPRNRAERRHHDRRIKGKVRTFLIDAWHVREWLKEPNELEVWVCKMAAARKPCSCHMCGNPRRTAGGENERLTMQEKRSLVREKDFDE
jgi:hypothetical protein